MFDFICRRRCNNFVCQGFIKSSGTCEINFATTKNVNAEASHFFFFFFRKSGSLLIKTAFLIIHT